MHDGMVRSGRMLKTVSQLEKLTTEEELRRARRSAEARSGKRPKTARTKGTWSGWHAAWNRAAHAEQAVQSLAVPVRPAPQTHT